MTSVRLERKSFRTLVDTMINSNLLYHRERTKMWEALVQCRKAASDDTPSFLLSLSDFLTLKSYLTARSQKLQENDSASLAFQTTLASVAESMFAEDEEQPDDVVAHAMPHSDDKKDEPPSASKSKKAE